MDIQPSDLERKNRYALMIATVVPRPIGWISSLSADGVPNLAPFSFFGGVTADPFTVMLSVGRRKGQPKDTARNLLDTGEAVIHLTPRVLAEKMVATSAEVGPQVDEFQLAGLTPIPATQVRPFRVAEAPLALEAKVVHHLEVGTDPVDMFLLEVLWIHAADEILTDGLPDPQKWQPIGRLGGQLYSPVTELLKIPRPT